MEIFEIDLLRGLFVKEINDEDVFLASFYEQIKDEQQINRYVEKINDLIKAQNQDNYKAMGIISQNGSAEIMNIKTNYISPLEYLVRFDIPMINRDEMVLKLKQVINNMRGRKFDILILENGEIIITKTPQFNLEAEKPIIEEDVYFEGEGEVDEDKIRQAFEGIEEGEYSIFYKNTDDGKLYKISVEYQGLDFLELDMYYQSDEPTYDGSKKYWYDSNDGVLYQYLGKPMSGWFELPLGGYTESETEPSTPEQYDLWVDTSSTPYKLYQYDYLPLIINTTLLANDFSKYKISISFNGLQSEEPYINHGQDRVWIFFDGNATIVSEDVMLGNDIVETYIDSEEVEPIEIPSGLAVKDEGFQTWNSGYKNTERNLGFSNQINYSFVYKTGVGLFDNMYRYGRYGDGLTDPNKIFEIVEIRYSFGEAIFDKLKAKIGDVQINNTNGDVITLLTSFKVGWYE